MMKREERRHFETLLDQMDKELNETNFIMQLYINKFHTLEKQRLELSETISRIKRKLRDGREEEE